jgi:hypothetical protein
MSISSLRWRVASALITAVAAAGVAVTTGGLAGAAVPAAAATQSMGPAIYTQPFAGYETGGGRWFRFVSTTLTLEPPQASSSGPIAAAISLQHGGLDGTPSAALIVMATGDRVLCSCGGTFRISPSYGDRLALSIYYDRHGHDYYTVTDLTRHATQTVRQPVPAVIYDGAGLLGEADGVTPPPADTRQWQFTSSHLTTYTGARGTILGPWTTSPVIATSTGTSSGVVVQSPSRLHHGGQNFGIWLRTTG